MLGRGQLHWPEGGCSKKSALGVKKLAPLRRAILQHVDPSAGPHADQLCDLLAGMLRSGRPEIYWLTCWLALLWGLMCDSVARCVLCTVYYAWWMVLYTHAFHTLKH